MSVASSIWPQAAESPPPRNESGPTSGEIEPAKHAGTRSKESTHDAAAVKPAPWSDIEAKVAAMKPAKALACDTVFDRDTVREASLRRIGAAVGETPTQVLQRGDVWDLIFPDGAPCVLSVRALWSSPADFTDSVIRSRKKIPNPISREKLREIGQAVLDAAKPTYTATEADETRAWVLSRAWVDNDLTQQRRDDEIDDTFRVRNYISKRGEGSPCWREGDFVCVHHERLLAALQLGGMRSLTMKDLTIRLGRIGFEYKQRSFRAKSAGHSGDFIWSRGKSIKCRLWQVELDVLLADDVDACDRVDAEVYDD